MSGTLAKQLQDAFSNLSFSEHVVLAPYTYMKSGGTAEVFVIVKHSSDLASLIQYCVQHDIKFTLFGGASNVIVSDKGIRGLVIKNQSAEVVVQRGEHFARVVAESGIATNMLVRKTIDEGLEGLEYFLGVPGTLGGAIYNNSHYLTELIGNVVKEVEVFQIETQSIQTYTQEDMQFAYDFSLLQKTHDIVLKVVFELEYGNKDSLEQKAREVSKKRAATQPLGTPSSGCIFKNFHKPTGEVLHAGQLIDQAGLKGYRIGDAMVSDIHANFIVNVGHATSTQVLELANYVQGVIKEKYGIELEKEVFILQ